MTSGQVATLQIGLSLLVLLVLLWVNFGRNRLRHYRMRRPFDVYFKLGADADAPTATEISVPAHSTEQIDIRIAPKLHFVQNEIIVGIGGDVESRPRLVAMNNPFVKRGKGTKGSPEDTGGHYTDYNDNYHIQERVDRTRGNKYALGFIVETRDPGAYPLTVKAMTDDGEGKAANQLIVRVK